MVFNILNCNHGRPNESALIFRLSEHVPEVIRQVLTERGWTEYDEDDVCASESEWNLWWRTQRFRRSEHAEIEPWQRINHFPQTDAITRKDCLVRNLRRLRCIHGSQFDFHPHSYILPNEYTKFVADYGKEVRQKGRKNVFWICKPSVLSRGRGIFVFNDLKDLNYDCSVIVQHYIPKPLLMSGYKFDLRIYVCVPSFHPLTVYIYQEGLVRFSTEKFNLDNLGNVFSHLTNTSINKYGPAFSIEKERVGSGCKWILAKLRTFLSQIEELDEMVLWQKINNIVTLVLCTQASYVPKSQNCFEIFGFDIIIDENFKPWLLEVNFSPALSMDCQADFIVKRQLINDLIDLLNFKDSDAERSSSFIQPQTSNSPRRSSLNTPSDLSGGVGVSKSYTFGQKASTLPRSKTVQENLHSSYSLRKNTRKSNTNHSLTSRNTFPLLNKAKTEMKRDVLERRVIPTSISNSNNSTNKESCSSNKQCCEGNYVDNQSKSSTANDTKLAWTISDIKTKDKNNNVLNSSFGKTTNTSITRRNNNRSPGYKSLPKMNNSNLISFFNKTASTPKQLKDKEKFPEPLNLDSIAEEEGGDNSSSYTPKQDFILGNKSVRKKKTANSAPVSRSPVQHPLNQQNIQSARTSKQKPKQKYISPYSTRSTSRSHNEIIADNQWPKTRVGDFILTFPWNEATRKASMTNVDIRVVIREQQKIMKKLLTINANETIKKRRASQTLSTTDALELSFELKFDNSEKNPLYFWGPQHPPLLSNITG